MNIVFTGNFLGRGWDGSITDENHISDALEELGHRVYKIQREDHSVLPAFEDISFVMIAQYNGYPDDWVGRLKEQYGCVVAYHAYDYQEDGQEWHERLIRECDVYLSKPLSDAKKHKNWRWLSQDFAPSFLDRVEEPVEKDIEVLFTGSWVPWESGQERVKYLKAIDEKYDLHIYGVTPEQWRNEGFKNVHGPVMDHELPALIARAKINFSMDHVWAPGYWSDRNAQIMACGGLVVFKYVPLSETRFNQYIMSVFSIEDCIYQIGELLNASQEDIAEVTDTSYWYAHNNLMVESRVRDLLAIMREFL